MFGRLRGRISVLRSRFSSSSAASAEDVGSELTASAASASIAGLQGFISLSLLPAHSGALAVKRARLRRQRGYHEIRASGQAVAGDPPVAVRGVTHMHLPQVPSDR